MADLVVTSKTNAIKVEFNDSPFYDKRSGNTYTEGTWAKSDIANIKLTGAEDYVIVQERDEFEWTLSYDGSGSSFKVDSVDAVVPTDNKDLYDFLSALIE